MNLLTIEHLTKAYAQRKLFDDAEFAIHEGDKIGVIGINGADKRRAAAGGLRQA